ncbi:MAG: mycofactocin biosynthesis chaperone MftB [Actinomycetota bacterium]
MTGRPTTVLSPEPQAPRPEPAVDVDRAYRLDRRVVVRPAVEGAVAYHFGTRRAVFLHEPRLPEFLNGLEHEPSLASALDALVLDTDDRARWEDTLARLARAQVIHVL